MTTAALPLLAGHTAGSVIAWLGEGAITAGAFVADVQALAARLPAHGALVNLCGDRYRFAVGLGAAMLRGHVNLLPPNALPATLAGLRRRHPALYALVDDDATDAAGLPTVHCIADGTLPPVAEVPTIAPSQPAATLLTSGSTGEPQPHSKEWGPVVENIRAEARRVAESTGGDPTGAAPLAGWSLVATVPAQHSYGFESSVLLAMLSGAAFDAGRPYFPADIAQRLATLPRPRALVTTPFHLKTFLAADVPHPPVDLVLCATAPLSPQLAKQTEAVLGGVLVEIYGCTEAGQVATRRTAQTERWQTFGALRIEQRKGEGADDAQFWVQGGHVVEPTRLSDVLVLDDERHFRLLGRANDVINVAGKRSSLAHLNYHLNSIPGVHDGAFWLPDDEPDGVVRPVAFVVAPELEARTIVQALRERVEAVFLPRRVVHVPVLPREATGKLTAQTLRRFAHETLHGGAGA
jgi:acyl-coenzyme A synthetase/AMP-(fatty) acid ligase